MGTLLALVVATVLVPVVPRKAVVVAGAPGYAYPRFVRFIAPPALEWERIDRVMAGLDPYGRAYRWEVAWPEGTGETAMKDGVPVLRLEMLALTLAVLVALGGLLTLYFRTRRGAA